MNKITKISIISGIVILIFLYIYNSNNQENYINIKTTDITNPQLSWKINKCPYSFTDNFKKVFDANNIIKTDSASNPNTIHVPCTYDNTEKEINEMNFNTDQDNKVFILHNADEIVAKDYLWKNLVQYYGLDKTLKLIPMTYILYDPNDVKRLKQEHTENKIYILKKNVQRQEGLKISNDIDYITSNKDGYPLAQELLQDPYLINGRKINLRVYVLVVCNKENYDVYTYNDGFMYYTKDLFKENSLDFGPNVTTGYIDRKVYEVNPLTHDDFRAYLDKPRDLTIPERNVRNNGNVLSTYVFNNINNLVKDVFTAFYKKIGYGDKLYNHVSFQLFGIDVAINKNLEATIMEVNKGPDLNSKDEKDGNLKRGVIKDILKVIKMVPNDDDDNRFIHVVEI